VLAAALPFQAVAAAPPPQICDFQLGFAALHDLIPDRVGDCVSDETHNPDNGDALQETTGGLLVWRKADNWTAFTNGATTWINGPCGLQSRPNAERFPWEQGGGCSGAQGGQQGGAEDFVGSWGKHGFGLNIAADGLAIATWRVYQWCTEAPEPCDELQDNSILPGGHASIEFHEAADGVARGTVFDSSDPGTLVGSVTMTLQQYGMAELDSDAGVSMTLCGPHYLELAPPDVIASAPCGA